MAILLSVLFGLVSMVAYGLGNAFSKPLAQHYGADKMLFLRGIAASVILAIVSIPSMTSLGDWHAVLLTILLGMAGYLPVLAFTHAIKTSRLGIVSPIAGTSPLITVLLSFLFLAVPISSWQWAAIGLVILANIAVSFDFKNWRESQALQLSSGIPFALLASIGWGLFFFLLVPATRSLGPFLSACLVEVGVTIAAGAHVRLQAKQLNPTHALRLPIIYNALCICIGTTAFTVGVLYFNVAIVATLSNSVALVAAFLGVALYNEKLRPREMIAGAIMIAGVAVLSLLHG